MAMRGFSASELDLASLLAEVDGEDRTSPSHALIARILKEDRVSTPDADLQSLLHVLEPQERHAAAHNDVTIRIHRDGRGGAGFAFDCTNLKISAVKKDRRDLSSMQIGDVIVAVNDRPVANAQEYHKAAKAVKDFTLTLRRTGNAAAVGYGQPAPVPKAAAKAGAKAAAKGKAKPAVHRPRGPSEAERRAMALDIDNMSYEELLALDEVLPPVKKPGLGDALVDKLPVEHVCGGGGECAICLEDFYDGDAVTCLPCSHMFHIGCAQEWLKLQSRCPYCNLELAQ